MSVLAGLQRDFMESLFATGAPRRAGLEVYRRNVLANLGAALAATYPVVRRLVGDAFFDEAARQFASRTPSTSGDLHEYGAGFGQFLGAYPHAQSLPYLPDVACLEWLCHESYHASDAQPFDFAALARVDPSRQGAIRFVLAPAARLMRSPHPVVAIWEANQPGRDGTPDAPQESEWVLVRREENAVRVACIAPCDWEFLARIGAGATLEEAGSSTALARYVAEGVIAGFAPPAAHA